MEKISFVIPCYRSEKTIPIVVKEIVDTVTAHGGYDQTYANEDPDRVLPVDVMRNLEKEGKIGKLYDYYYATVGNGTESEDGYDDG